MLEFPEITRLHPTSAKEDVRCEKCGYLHYIYNPIMNVVFGRHGAKRIRCNQCKAIWIRDPDYYYDEIFHASSIEELA